MIAVVLEKKEKKKKSEEWDLYNCNISGLPLIKYSNHFLTIKGIFVVL